jgi:hypothetical protein
LCQALLDAKIAKTNPKFLYRSVGSH